MLLQDPHLVMSPQSHSSTTVKTYLLSHMLNQAKISQMHLSLDTCALELAYSQACGHFETICESEKARHLRLQILLLENENNELYSQLAQADGRIDELENYADDERQEWESAIGQLDSVQKNLRIRNRENETLKVIRDRNYLVRITYSSFSIGRVGFLMWCEIGFNEIAYREIESWTRIIKSQA